MAFLNRNMMLICLVAALNCACIGYDSSMMSSINILVRNSPLSPSSTVLLLLIADRRLSSIQSSFSTYFGLDPKMRGLLTAAQNLGSIAAAFFAGHIADKWGRKMGILISACIVLVASAILSTANTRAQFFVGRILVGAAKAVDVAAVPTYLVELSPPSRRGFVAGLYWACWLLGAIISAGVGYGARSVAGHWSWRIICIVMSGPALACIALLPFIPESPRWLISCGKEAEGLKILAQFHGGGDSADPFVLAQFREIKETIYFEQENRFESYRAWFKSFMSTRSNLYRGYILITLGIFEQTVGSSIISFYLSSVLTLAGVTDEKEQFAINIGQTCVAFVSALVGICLIDKIGRIPMMVAGSTFCAAVLACMAGLTANHIDQAAGRNGVIAMVFLFQMGYSSTWTPLSFSYCAEVLNFTIRAKGMALVASDSYHSSALADILSQVSTISSPRPQASSTNTSFLLVLRAFNGGTYPSSRTRALVLVSH